jgi:hypothetical protein
VTDALSHLLALQDLDTSITQMEHRRDALAETSGLAAAERELAALTVQRADAEARRSTLAAAQSQLEEQIGGVTERRDLVEKRLYAATGTAGRDLQAMNEEVKHLTDRRADLEEQELVIMLELDPIDAELTALHAQSDPLEVRAKELRDQVEHDRLEIEAALASAVGTRAAEADQLPGALFDRYEKLRVRLKGTGAARLIKSHCDGCHLELSSVEVERIRAMPPGEAATCEQCGRILVPS